MTEPELVPGGPEFPPRITSPPHLQAELNLRPFDGWPRGGGFASGSVRSGGGRDGGRDMGWGCRGGDRTALTVPPPHEALLWGQA